jgi:hypothetical protein
MSKFLPLELCLNCEDDFVFVTDSIEQDDLFRLDDFGRPVLATDADSKTAALKIVARLMPSKKFVDSMHPDNQLTHEEAEEYGIFEAEQSAHWKKAFSGQFGLMSDEKAIPWSAQHGGYLLIAYLLIKLKWVKKDEMANLASDSSDVMTKVIRKCEGILGERTLRDHIKRAAKKYIR